MSTIQRKNLSRSKKNGGKIKKKSKRKNLLLVKLMRLKKKNGQHSAMLSLKQEKNNLLFA
jgi:hypothetical protein